MALRATKHRWPIWKWPNSGWVWTVAGALLGAVVLVLPSVSNLALHDRLSLAVCLIIAPFVLVALAHAVRLVLTALFRVAAYGDLHRESSERILELEKQLTRHQQAITELLDERQRWKAVDLVYCFMQGLNSYVAIAKNHAHALEKGEKITVIDESGGVMGTFVVCDEKTHMYIAKSNGDMDLTASN
jgi:membrane protein implicated in regulation of membrane protease activity